MHGSFWTKSEQGLEHAGQRVKRGLKNVRIHSPANQILVLHKEWEQEFRDTIEDARTRRGVVRRRGGPVHSLQLMATIGEPGTWPQMPGPVKPTTEGNGSGLELKIEVRDGNSVLNNQLIIRRGQEYVVDERLFIEQTSKAEGENY